MVIKIRQFGKLATIDQTSDISCAYNKSGGNLQPETAQFFPVANLLLCLLILW